MKETIAVKAQLRENTGTSESGRIRRSGGFPAVVYGKGVPPVHVQIGSHDFEQMLGRHHSEHMMLNLEVTGQEALRVLLKSVQHHPISGNVLHADFQVVALDERLRVEIPLELTGEPVGVTRDGGLLDHLLREVEVECLPADLMEEIILDVSGLEIGQHLTVSDVVLDPSRYRILTPLEVSVASVTAPRVEDETGSASAEGGAEEPTLVKERESKEQGEGE